MKYFAGGLCILLMLNLVILWPRRPTTISLERIRIPTGQTAMAICAVDKGGILNRVQLAVYDTDGHFIEQAFPDGVRPCIELPRQLQAGDYFVGLFTKR